MVLVGFIFPILRILITFLAFVNFIEVKDLLKFAKARLGVKWNMFCSEKVLQMSYANFQYVLVEVDCSSTHQVL